MIKVGFKRLTDNAVLPLKAHATDSGFDLFANEEVLIAPGETKVIKTGIAVKLPAGYEAQVRPRSGVTSKTKLRVQLGTIDNSYTGEIGIIVDNIELMIDWNNFTTHTTSIKGDTVECMEGVPWETYSIKKGDKLAQLVIAPIPAVETYEFTKTPITERGENGFGSSGY